MRHTVEVLTGDSKDEVDKTNLGYLGSSKPGPKESVIVTFDGNSTEVALLISRIEEMTHALKGNRELALVYLALDELPVFSHSLHKLWLSQFEQRLWRDPKEGGFRVMFPNEVRQWAEDTARGSADLSGLDIEERLLGKIFDFASSSSEQSVPNIREWTMPILNTVVSRVDVEIRAGYSARSGAFAEFTGSIFPAGSMLEDGSIWEIAGQLDTISRKLKNAGFQVREIEDQGGHELIITSPEPDRIEIKVDLGFTSEAEALASQTMYESGTIDPIKVTAYIHFPDQPNKDIDRSTKPLLPESFFNRASVVLSYVVDELHACFGGEKPNLEFNLTDANEVE